MYVTQDFGFGDEREAIESDENQLAGTRPAMTRYSITVGRFTVTDFFDNNRYTHDPRTQFMGWAVMYNGAWDYPADTRGYTWGWVHEFHTRRWSLRYASAAEPRVANGLRFDRRLLRDRGDVFEGEMRASNCAATTARSASGITRTTPISGTYAEALRAGGADRRGTPDVTATRRAGTLKYGFGVSADQEIDRRYRRLRAAGDGTTARPRASPSRPSTGWPRRRLGGRNALEAPARHGGHRDQPRRTLGRPRAIPGARRPGFSDRRRRSALRPRAGLGKLLLGAPDGARECS